MNPRPAVDVSAQAFVAITGSLGRYEFATGLPISADVLRDQSDIASEFVGATPREVLAELATVMGREGEVERKWL